MLFIKFQTRRDPEDQIALSEPVVAGSLATRLLEGAIL